MGRRTTVEIDDLLAERQVSENQIELFSFYNKMDYKPVNKLSSTAHEKWITKISIGWLMRKSWSCWSKINMASVSNEKWCAFFVSNIL